MLDRRFMDNGVFNRTEHFMRSASLFVRFIAVFLTLYAATVFSAEPSAPKSAVAHPLDKVAPLIPRRVLFGNPDKAMARMSHDGKQLAYLAPVDDVLNVWVGPIDNPDAAKPVT